MANTSGRMLRLLSLLQTHRYWPGTELADRLEVSPRTLRRDVDRLRELGYPVDANRGVAGGYQLQSGAAMPPLLLDDEEAVAIAVGLRTAAGGAVEGIEETSMRALTKVIQVMPPRLRRRVEALRTYTVPAFWSTAGQTVDAMALTVIAQSCRDDERLRFGYTAYDGEATRRHVEPHRLVSLGRRWYLVAWDVERHDWRTFRADRMVDPTATGARFRQRDLPGGDAGAFVRDRINNRPTQHVVIVDVQVPADQLRTTVAQWATVEPLTETSCRMTMPTDTLDWPTMVLGAAGVDFEVVQPPELRDHLRAMGELFIRNTA
jgi:predicted DNA-binding transcriptional regulator YafY